MASKKGELAEGGKPQKHVWANRYAGELKDIFSIQDEITMNIIIALHVKLTEGEQAALRARGTYLAGLWGTSGTYFGDMEGGD